MLEVYRPDEAAAATAHIKGNEYETLYKQSLEQPDQFWAVQAESLLYWHKKWDSDVELCK